RRLVEERQLVVRQVDQLDLRVAALARELDDPAGDRLGGAPGASAADDDANPDHVRPPFARARPWRRPPRAGAPRGPGASARTPRDGSRPASAPRPAPPAPARDRMARGTGGSPRC